MAEKFNYEIELVDNFIFNKKKNGNTHILVREMNIRHGNIDIVSVENVHLPFNHEQMKALSNPAAALIFTTIKNTRPIKKQTLYRNLGLSESTINVTLSILLKNNLIEKSRDNYTRKSYFTFPKTSVIGYEAKLTDFDKVFYQAKQNLKYVDLSYIVFPYKKAIKILDKHEEFLRVNGIGLIGVQNNRNVTLIKSVKTKGIKDSIRLLNLAKANVYMNSNY